MPFLFAPALRIMNSLRFAGPLRAHYAAGGVLIAGLMFQFLQSVGEPVAPHRAQRGVGDAVALRGSASCSAITSSPRPVFVRQAASENGGRCPA